MTNRSEGAAGGVPGRRAPKPTPLGLMVLSLLAERPMHPYEMQRLMVARGNDHVVRVQRGSLYPAVERLVAGGLVTRAATTRAGRRPERTVYRLTEAGQRATREWLLGMLSRRHNEYPELGAALSFVGVVDSATFAEAIRQRRDQLAEEVAGFDAKVESLAGALPRVFLLENEFLQAVRRAELGFLDGVLDDVDQGRLAWDRDSIAAWAAEVAANDRFADAVGRPVDDDPGGGRPPVKENGR